MFCYKLAHYIEYYTAEFGTILYYAPFLEHIIPSLSSNLRINNTKILLISV